MPREELRWRAGVAQQEPNTLVLRIQPDEGIALRFGAKEPGATMKMPYGEAGFSAQSMRDDFIAQSMAWRREELVYQGRCFSLPLPADQGTGLAKPLKMLTHLRRDRIPIYLASLGERSVELAEHFRRGCQLGARQFAVAVGVEQLEQPGVERVGRGTGTPEIAGVAVDIEDAVGRL